MIAIFLLSFTAITTSSLPLDLNSTKKDAISVTVNGMKLRTEKEKYWSNSEICYRKLIQLSTILWVQLQSRIAAFTEAVQIPWFNRCQMMTENRLTSLSEWEEFSRKVPQVLLKMPKCLTVWSINILVSISTQWNISSFPFLFGLFF